MSKIDFKNVIKKEDKEYSKWSLLALLFLALFLFLILKNDKVDQKNPIENQPENNLEQVDTELSEDILNNEEPKVEQKEEVKKETQPKSNTPTTNTKEDSAKFSDLIQKGNTAFVNGDNNLAISYYNQALAENNSDKVYVRLFTVYGAQGNWSLAKNAIDTAIILNPSYTDYWVSKIVMLDEKMNYSFSELKKIYDEALGKVDSATKINLVTSFARVAEKRNLYSEAISLWEYAKALYPQNSVMYDAEIQRLRN